MGGVIELKDVSYYYPLTEKPAIHNMEYSFEKGKLYGVIGENGSGKTTFCNLIRGFAPVSTRGNWKDRSWLKGKKPWTMMKGSWLCMWGMSFRIPLTRYPE